MTARAISEADWERFDRPLTEPSWWFALRLATAYFAIYAIFFASVELVLDNAPPRWLASVIAVMNAAIMTMAQLFGTLRLGLPQRVSGVARVRQGAVVSVPEDGIPRAVEDLKRALRYRVESCDGDAGLLAWKIRNGAVRVRVRRIGLGLLRVQSEPRWPMIVMDEARSLEHVRRAVDVLSGRNEVGEESRCPT